MVVFYDSLGGLRIDVAVGFWVLVGWRAPGRMRSIRRRCRAGGGRPGVRLDAGQTETDARHRAGYKYDRRASGGGRRRGSFPSSVTGAAR